MSEDIDSDGRVATSHIRGVDSLPSLGKSFQCCSTPTIVPNGGQMVAGYLTSVHFPNVTCLCLLMTELRGLGRNGRWSPRPLHLSPCPICSQRKVIIMTSLYPMISSGGTALERDLRGSLIFTTHSNALDHEQKLLWRFLGFHNILILNPFSTQSHCSFSIILTLLFIHILCFLPSRCVIMGGLFEL